MYKRKNKSTETKSKLRRINKLKKHSEKNLVRNNSFKNNDYIRKEKIHLEVINLIKENMINIESKMNNDIYSINNSKTYEEENFKNYNGEKLSINSNYPFDKTEESLSNSHQKSEKDDYEAIKTKTKHKNGFQNKINLTKKNKPDKINFSLKKLLSENNNIYDTLTEEETLVYSSNFGRINKSTIENDNMEKEKEKEVLTSTERISVKRFNHKGKITYNYNYSGPKKILIQANSSQSDKQKRKSFLKEGKFSIPNNFSLYESTSTSNSNEKNKLKFHQISDENNNVNYFKKNETELIHFFNEINLPSNYAKKCIENGFDDLNIILNLTKTSTAVTNQNLKDIGISNASHRAKILIHLEEKAEIIPYHIERNIIYNKNDNNKDNKFIGERLFKFFNDIGCEKYLNNFKLNGYFNVELLLTQMFIRQPINSEILKEDFYIEDELIRNKIINKLEIESKKYMKRLPKRNLHVNNINNNITYEDKLFHNPCESCLIF